MAKICPSCNLAHKPGQSRCIPSGASIDQPSVIVEMSFVEKHFPVLYSKHVKIGFTVVIILACIATGALWYLNNRLEAAHRTPPPSTTVSFTPQAITLTIIASPRVAAIYVDGRRQTKNPAILEIMSDTQPHTIVAKAPGHEPLERDVKFNRTQTIRLELVEIIVPEGNPDGSETDVESPVKEIEEVVTE